MKGSSRDVEKIDKSGDGARRGPHSLAVISDGARLDGFLRSSATIRMDGAFKGTIIADHELIIDPQGRVEARVMARRVVVAGFFQGEMAVLDELEITPTGRFMGTLYQKEPALRVSRGGRFEARSVFADDLQAVVAPWAVPPPPSPRRDAERDQPIAPDDIKL
jgi:cytoskeletal protein CcmA (bactofilin family)